MVPVYLCEEVFSRVYPLFEDDEKNRFLMVEDVVDTEVNEDVELPLVVELIDVRRGLEGLLRLEYEDTVESDGDRHDNVGLVFGVLNCDRIDCRLISGLGLAFDVSMVEQARCYLFVLISFGKFFNIAECFEM